jgi:transposase
MLPRATIRRWQGSGLGGLWSETGRGAKRKWSETDLQYLEQCLEKERRTYNSLQRASEVIPGATDKIKS